MEFIFARDDDTNFLNWSYIDMFTTKGAKKGNFRLKKFIRFENLSYSNQKLPTVKETSNYGHITTFTSNEFRFSLTIADSPIKQSQDITFFEIKKSKGKIF